MQGKFSDGKTRDAVAPAAGAVAGEMYRANGWNGVCEVDTAVGATYAQNVDPTAFFWIKVPVAVAAAVGATLYMPAAATAAGSTTLTAVTTDVPALKVVIAKDANNYVGARLIP